MGTPLREPRRDIDPFIGMDRFDILDFKERNMATLGSVQMPDDICTYLRELLAALCNTFALTYGANAPSYADGQNFLACRVRGGIDTVREALTSNAIFHARDERVDGCGTRDLMKVFLRHPDTSRKLALRLGVPEREVIRVVRLALDKIAELDRGAV